jgi:peptidoglycan/xylan/chitin deacetylase (PgdA/CDA1 family)
VSWLRNNFDVVSESELLDLVQAREFKGRYVAITFDDGYRDNYELAYPVLKAYSLPAIFFIAPGIINGRKVGWWDIIAFLVKRCSLPAINIRGECLQLAGAKQQAIQRLTDLMKTEKAEETATLLEELSVASGVPLPDEQLQSEQFMSWDEIREVNRNGVAIGSHTQTHRVLATLSENDQKWELRASKEALENRLERPVRTIAYPVGRYGQFTPATMRAARECGYECAFSFHTGANYSGSVNRYNIKRIACGSRLDALFACGVYMPRYFTWYHPEPRTYLEAFAS